MSSSAAPEPESPEPTPAAAEAVFGAQLVAAERYAAMLVGPGATRGLIGPREAPRIWSRHVLHCAVAAEVMAAGSRVVDLGSGAGLPGIPLALARPDLDVVLVEPMARRADFLAEVVSELGLANIAVRHCRAEALAERAAYDVATARAVSDLMALYRWSRPLLRTGGILAALKGARAAEEIAIAARPLRAMGGVASLTTVGVGVVEPPTTLVLVSRSRE